MGKSRSDWSLQSCCSLSSHPKTVRDDPGATSADRGLTQPGYFADLERGIRGSSLGRGGLAARCDSSSAVALGLASAVDVEGFATSTARVVTPLSVLFIA